MITSVPEDLDLVLIKDHVQPAVFVPGNHVNQIIDPDKLIILLFRFQFLGCFQAMISVFVFYEYC